MAAIAFASTQDLLGQVANFDGMVLADNYWGQTIQVRPGQVVRKTFHPPVDPNTITLSSDAVRWSGIVISVRLAHDDRPGRLRGGPPGYQHHQDPRP
jgi:hypothetical protein